MAERVRVFHSQPNKTVGYSVAEKRPRDNKNEYGTKGDENYDDLTNYCYLLSVTQIFNYENSNDTEHLSISRCLCGPCLVVASICTVCYRYARIKRCITESLFEVS